MPSEEQGRWPRVAEMAKFARKGAPVLGEGDSADPCTMPA